MIVYHNHLLHPETLQAPGTAPTRVEHSSIMLSRFDPSPQHLCVAIVCIAVRVWGVGCGVLGVGC